MTNGEHAKVRALRQRKVMLTALGLIFAGGVYISHEFLEREDPHLRNTS